MNTPKDSSGRSSNDALSLPALKGGVSRAKTMNTNILKDNAETNNETPELVMDDISNELSRVLDSIQLQRSFSSSLNEKHIDNE